MKKPFEQIIELYSENLERVRENQLRNFENSEKFMLWIVGFAIGGLSLIISNIVSFQDHYSSTITKIVLISLATSIVSGIIYRWAFYTFQIHYQQIEFYLKGAFSNLPMMPTSKKDVTTEIDFNRLAIKMNFDFGIDLTNRIEEYEHAEKKEKEFLLDDLKNYYKEMNDLSVYEYEFALKYVDEIHRKAFGLSEKQIEKLKNTDRAKLLKRYGKITVVGFAISCLTFIFVIILLTALY